MTIGYKNIPSFLALVELNIIYIMRHKISSGKSPFRLFFLLTDAFPHVILSTRICRQINKSIHHEARPAFFLQSLSFTVHRQVGTADGRIHRRRRISDVRLLPCADSFRNGQSAGQAGQRVAQAVAFQFGKPFRLFETIHGQGGSRLSGRTPHGRQAFLP